MLALNACSTNRFFEKKLAADIRHSPVFKTAFTGFHLVDATSGQTLCAVNAGHYFTPASNAKILTLAACLALLGDSLPRFRYQYVDPDTSKPYGLVLVTATGDPTTLHPAFAQWQNFPAFCYGHPAPPAYGLNPAGAKTWNRYGAGWMWDDFGENYSVELSPLPVYGNLVRVCWENGGWRAYPVVFQADIQVSETKRQVARDALGPTIWAPARPDFKQDSCFKLPMYRPSASAWEVFSGAFPNGIAPLPGNPELPLRSFPNTWYATPTDTVLRRMMHQSDNFLAEQLLLVAAAEKFDTLDQHYVFRWALDSLFAGLPNPPRWVDGSGLSRYNQLSPVFLTSLLRRLFKQQPRERLLPLFPAGGVSGTVQNWYRGAEGQPFVFAKTGTMTGVHCLGGYLIGKSGRVYAFSFMHNNILGSVTPWKQEMQRLLLKIYERG